MIRTNITKTEVESGNLLSDIEVKQHSRMQKYFKNETAGSIYTKNKITGVESFKILEPVDNLGRTVPRYNYIGNELTALNDDVVHVFVNKRNI